MKILLISDTHCRKIPNLPDADLLIHSGDWSGSGKKDETVDFANWMEEIRDDYGDIVVVPGNHDRYVQTDIEGVKKLFADKGVRFLCDEGDLIQGKWIYGMPWTPTFGRWAFMAGEATREAKVAAIPDDTEILVTHGPPRGIADEVIDMWQGKILNVGCLPLLRRVNELKKLQLHSFGHIHEGYGTTGYQGKLLVNASHMDKNYRPVNPPITVVLP